MNIFVSSQSIDGTWATSLVEGLRRVHVGVEHSPRNPMDGEDPRWHDWYKVGLPAAVGRCDLFVIVIDRGWDSSTWMASEADEAIRRGLRVLYWNPDRIVVNARGMGQYLRAELPSALEDALVILLRREAE